MSLRTDLVTRPRFLKTAAVLGCGLMYAGIVLTFYQLGLLPTDEWPKDAQILAHTQSLLLGMACMQYMSTREFIKGELARIEDPMLREVMTRQWEDSRAETVAAQRAILKRQKAKLQRDREAWLLEREEWRAGVIRATYAQIMDQAERGHFCLKCQGDGQR